MAGIDHTDNQGRTGNQSNTDHRGNTYTNLGLPQLLVRHHQIKSQKTKTELVPGDSSVLVPCSLTPWLLSFFWILTFPVGLWVLVIMQTWLDDIRKWIGENPMPWNLFSYS